jgi:putative oxidoreductase
LETFLAGGQEAIAAPITFAASSQNMLLNSEEVSVDFGALLRLTAGGTLFWHHGLVKLMKFSELSGTFFDPIGLGSGVSLALILFAEVFCALCVVLGLWTRITTIPPIIGMAVAAFMAQGDGPFAKQELGILYMMMFIVIFFIGSGKYSLGRLSFK